MGVTAQLAARQSGAGEPIRITGRRTSVQDVGSPSWTWFGFGVTLTSSPPATFAGFAHYQGGSNVSGLWRGSDKYDFQYDDADVVFGYNRLAITRVELIDLDANYVAGRYLWFVTAAVDPPESSTVPEALSAPYLIR